MNRRIIYVLLFTVLYHFGYKAAFSAERLHNNLKSPITSTAHKDKVNFQHSQEYIQIDTGTALNESEDEEQTTPLPKINACLKWLYYQSLKPITLTGKNGFSPSYYTTTPDKEKYILISVFRI